MHLFEACAYLIVFVSGQLKGGRKPPERTRKRVRDLRWDALKRKDTVRRPHALPRGRKKARLRELNARRAEHEAATRRESNCLQQVQYLHTTISLKGDSTMSRVYVGLDLGSSQF